MAALGAGTIAIENMGCDLHTNQFCSVDLMMQNQLLDPFMD